MKIAQKVRESAAGRTANSGDPGDGRDRKPETSAAKQNHAANSFPAASARPRGAGGGLVAAPGGSRSRNGRYALRVFKRTGSELYMGAGDREHD